jgi:nitrous oxidase accessory protein NosD
VLKARLAPLALSGLLAIGAATATAASAKTLYVSAKKGNNANPCTAKAPCRTINYAVAKAKSGDTVSVAAGTYSQYVLVTKFVKLVGVGHPVLNLKGKNNGFNIRGAKASGTVVKGFVVENATFEGIVAQQVSHLSILDNIVRHNDKGTLATKPTGECAPQGQIPGDCGEGIHLDGGVTDSRVAGNVVTGNTGGILLSDEFGPTARDLITGNRVVKNLYDCGITLASHNPKAVASKGKLAGVHNNTIRGNTVNGNGVKGEGAGILMATGVPGGGVFNNLVENNTANGNGLAGVTLHSHSPGLDLNGNRIINNSLSANGALGDPEFGVKPGQTVDILVGSAVTKLKGIVITGNTLRNAHYGIYTKNAPKVSAKANKFVKVTVKVKQI